MLFIKDFYYFFSVDMSCFRVQISGLDYLISLYFENILAYINITSHSLSILHIN